MTESSKVTHSLLGRQLRRLRIEESSLDPGANRLLAAVGSAYEDFDRTREMLERSLELSSQELRQANSELRTLLLERSAAAQQMEDLHTQRLEAAGLLAGGLAHDFNSLLTVIKGSCAVLLKSAQPGDPRNEALSQIDTAASRAAALTRQLLAFSRRQVLRPRVIDLNQTIAALEHIYRALVGDQIELRWSLDPTLPTVNADPTQIEQVLINLVVNARDSMPLGGIVELRTARASDEEEGMRGATGSRLIRLSIKDTGSGMSAEVKSKIFEPFFTTKSPDKGTGLGLSTVYGIIRQSGGFITVDSEVSKGTTFNVFLPESELGSAGLR